MKKACGSKHTKQIQSFGKGANSDAKTEVTTICYTARFKSRSTGAESSGHLHFSTTAAPALVGCVLTLGVSGERRRKCLEQPTNCRELEQMFCKFRLDVHLQSSLV